MNKKCEIGEVTEYAILGATKTVYGVKIVGVSSSKESVHREITLLAKNRKGLRNIYKILSLDQNKELPKEKDIVVSYEDIKDNRENVFVGLECTRNDLYQVWTDDEQDHEGEKTDALISKEYDIADFVIIQPWKYYVEMMGELANVLYPEEVVIKWLLSELVGTLEIFDKYAIATSTICKELAFTSDEMMNEYIQPEGYREKFFGPEMPGKIVLENPRIIADMIESISMEDALYEYERFKFRKPLKGKITEEGIRKFNDEINKYGGLDDESSLMDIYLDIDGTLKGTAAPLKDVIAFIEYCLDNHDVYWLTTHCKNGNNRTYEALDFLPGDVRIRAYGEIQETDWNVLKTDAIDFEYEFVWFDDTVMQAELDVLSENGAELGLFKIETDNPMCMKDALDYLKIIETNRKK